jgi:hypothetical protein
LFWKKYTEKSLTLLQINIYIYIYGKHCYVNYTYRWINLPRRKNDIRELSEELLVQKQEWEQWAIEE